MNSPTSPLTSPLFSVPPSASPLLTERSSSSPITLRSVPLTLQTSVYDGLLDGSYKLSSPLESTSTSKSHIVSRQPDLSIAKIIEEFGESKLFDDSRLSKLRVNAVKRYNKALLRQRQLLLSAHGSDKGLMPLNGELIYLELKICELDLTKVVLARDLKERYATLLVDVNDYQSPYNLDSEKDLAEKRMAMSFNEFYNVLQQLQYMELQKSTLVDEVQRQNHYQRGLKRFFKRVLHVKGEL